jgi:hypothetical protein
VLTIHSWPQALDGSSVARMVKVGDRVRLSNGQVGTVALEKVHGSITIHVPKGRGKIAVEAYPVLLESGEVRFFDGEALEELGAETP